MCVDIQGTIQGYIFGVFYCFMDSDSQKEEGRRDSYPCRLESGDSCIFFYLILILPLFY